MNRRAMRLFAELNFADILLRANIAAPQFYGPEDMYWPPLGLKGPVTFHGTPKEVIEKLRRYQQGRV